MHVNPWFGDFLQKVFASYTLLAAAIMRARAHCGQWDERCLCFASRGERL